jgi:hypothetical protein
LPRPHSKDTVVWRYQAAITIAFSLVTIVDSVARGVRNPIDLCESRVILLEPPVVEYVEGALTVVRVARKLIPPLKVKGQRPEIAQAGSATTSGHGHGANLRRIDTKDASHI